MANGNAAQAVDNDWDYQSAKAPADGDWDYQSASKAAPYTDLSQEENLRSAPFDILKGAGKGALNTAIGIGKVAAPDWLVNKVAGPEAVTHASQTRKALTTPSNDMQSLGYGGEQIGEFLLPGMGEEAAGEKAATLLPRLGRAAKPLGRIGYNAVTQGALNEAQGGNFGEGALLGGTGGAFGEAGRAIAPSLAESSLGIRKYDRAFGKTPGQEALELPGVRPGTVARNAGAKVSDLTNELERRAGITSQPVASTRPAIKVIDDEMAEADTRNAGSRYNQLSDLRKQLTTHFRTGQPLPQNMTPTQILNIKRGIGDLENSWNPETKGAMKGTVRKVYNALDKELDRTVPGSDELNQRISSLIPVKTRGGSTELNAELPQRVAHRIAAHTGALAGALAGGELGRERGGVPGALAGGVAGLVIPEMIGSPEARMAMAKLANSGIPARGATALSTRLLPRRLGEEPEEEPTQ